MNQRNDPRDPAARCKEPEPPSPKPADATRRSAISSVPQESSGTAFETALTRALERSPQVAIRADFVRNVLAALPASPGNHPRFALRSRTRLATAAFASHSAPQIGLRAAFGGAGVLFAILLLLTLFLPHVQPTHPILSLALCSTFAFEFAFLSLWLTLRRDTPL